MPARGFLNRAAEQWGDRPALIFDDHDWSYRKLADIVKARRQALGLSSASEHADEPAGDPLQLTLHLDPIQLTPHFDDESLVDILAYWSSNDPFALLHPGWTERERENAGALLRRGGLGRGDVVFFTSGTTGLPKGVVHTRESLFAGAQAIAGHFELAPRDRWFSPLSPAHVGGFAPVLRTLMTGGALVLPSHAGAHMLRGAMLEREVTIASLVPSMLRTLLRDPAVPSLRLLMIGGDALDEDDLVLAEARGYPIVPTYGMTETGAAIVDLLTGRAIGEAALRAGANGALSVRGPSLFRGYLSETGVESPLDEDGWFATGDRGRVSDSGDVVIEGRILPTFITTGGETIDANEVETVLLEIRGVTRALVVGVPDPTWGKVVGVVLWPADAITAESVRDHCRARLASHKRPRLLAVVSPERPAPADTTAAVAHLLEHGTPVTYP